MTDARSPRPERPQAPTAVPSPSGDSAELRYGNRLRTCISGIDEAALFDAHEFGRDRLNQGFGVLDVVALHNRLLGRLLVTRPPEDAAEWVAAAGRLLVESLTPFEMAHRGLRPAHAALRTSETRYRDLVDTATDIIFTANLEGRITSINRAGERLTGYTRDQALGLNLDAILAPAAGKSFRRFKQLRMGTLPSSTFYDVDVIARDGRRIPLEVSIRRIRERGKPVGVKGIARDISDRKHAEAALRHVNHHLEEKARRIAHALHDDAGQLLASLYLRVAELHTDLPAEFRPRMDDLRDLLDQVEDQVRRVAHELRPTILDDLGLVPACQFLAEGVSKRSGVHVKVDGTTGDRLPPDLETALYRVVQEALSNAAKHAKAQHITVEFARVGPRVSGTIRDDGQGFDLARVMARDGQHGLGLMGMRERLASMGGRLAIHSAPGEGTSIDFSVSVERV